MRAAAQAHPSEVTATNARAALLRLVVAFLATVLLLAIWRPTVLKAQAADTTTTAHVVKAGESLWLLAERYYGSGYAWQELARRNTLATTRGKVLLVGMKLRVPAKVPAQGVAKSSAAPVPDVATAVATAPASAPATGASLSEQTADKADAAPAAPAARAATTRPAAPTARTAAATSKPATGATTSARTARNAAVAPATTAAASAATVTPAAPVSAAAQAANAEPLQRAVGLHPQIRAETLLTRQTTRIGLVDRDDLRDARAGDVATVFLRRVPEAAEVDAQARALSKADAPAPRRGEYESAPFSVDAAMLLKSGQLLRRVGAPSPSSKEDRQRLLIADEVELTAPAGVSLSVGDRLVSVRLTPEVTKGVRVAIPTGVMRVIRVETGKPVVAVVQSQTGNVEQGQSVLMVHGQAAPLSARASSSENSDIATSVRWIDGSESLPTLQSFVLLGAGSAQGVQAGDEFELRSAKAAVPGNGNGDERIARARVVRVGASESSAIIVKQDRAEIAIGVAARRVARVP